MLSAIVLDCSVAIVWCFEDETHPYAEGVLDRLDQMRAVVPALFPFEFANALLVGERRGRSGAEGTHRSFQLIRSLPISIDADFTPERMDRVIALSREYNLSVYDASYLELAIRQAVPLASLDQKLASAARKANVFLADVS